MLCDECRLHEAVVHRISVTNGEKSVVHLCAQCAQKSGIHIIQPPGLMGILSGIQPAAGEPQLACVCGTTLAEFKKTGFLGCEKCYSTFIDQLLPLIKSAQRGRDTHIGRKAANAPGEPLARQNEDEVARLRERLKKAIEAEEYEKAAELSYKIRALLNGEGEDERQ